MEIKKYLLEKNLLKPKFVTLQHMDIKTLVPVNWKCFQFDTNGNCLVYCQWVQALDLTCQNCKKRWSYIHEAPDWGKDKIPQKYFVSIFWIFHFKQFGTLDSAIGPSLWIIKSLYQTQLLTSYQKSFFCANIF